MDLNKRALELAKLYNIETLQKKENTEAIGEILPKRTFFQGDLKLKLDGEILNLKVETLIWYNGPLMLIDEFGRYLLSSYDDGESEVWFLSECPMMNMAFLENKLDLSDVLDRNSGYVQYNEENDCFEKRGKFKDFVENIIFPKEGSKLGNLYPLTKELIAKITENVYIVEGITSEKN